MHRDPRFPPHFGDQWGNDYTNTPATSLPPDPKNLMPSHGIEFQPSEICPKNFIIFDQTDHRSQIMFHPAVAHKFGNPAPNMHSNYIPENFDIKRANDYARETPSFAEEDSDDINALLSMEEEEEEEDEYDEEEVSTARTYGCYGNNSPDTCSTRNYKPRKNASSKNSNSNSSSGESSSGERKRHKMKKMVKALRKIVPGGDQMNTANVLDEAVKYLKSLKVEVQKLDVGDFKN